jgi:hypothetical protein
MTGPEHYRASEHLLTTFEESLVAAVRSGSVADVEAVESVAVHTLAAAQVHATLALAAAQVLGTLPLAAEDSQQWRSVTS